MLWELITGKRPFAEGMQQDDLMAYFVEVQARDFSRDESTASERYARRMLEILMNECLEADPNDRPITAGELARRLEMCLSPKAQRLFQPRSRSRMQLMRDRPLLFIVLAGVSPNIVMCLLNIVFNLWTVIDKLFDNDLGKFFNKVILPANTLAYPWGVLGCIVLGLPIARALRQIKNTRKNGNKSKALDQKANTSTSGEQVPHPKVPIYSAFAKHAYE